jgi:hypothetical protein
MAHAAVVINEFSYDDFSTDDLEFVELYNNGASPVDISGWTLGGHDNSTTNGGVNPIQTIPGSTTIAAGGYYVIGNSGVSNVNLVASGGFLENDAESIELWNGAFSTSTLIDGVVYETNKGPTGGAANYGTLSPDMLTQTNTGGNAQSPGIWANTQASDLSGKPTDSLARFVDGRDTNNNGRDFGMRLATPGAANNPINITTYNVPIVTGQAPGTEVPGWGYSFVPPKVIDPTVADAVNPNAITAPPNSDRAIIAYDPSGGGNGVSAPETFNTGKSKFSIFAYFDTSHIPVNSNSSGTQFRGSEITGYGIGSTDALMNLTDASGGIGVSDSGNGTTGIAWLYERAGETSAGADDVSEKLVLVDAGDGGDSAAGGSNAQEWTVLATIDLGSTSSGWYELGIDINPDGSGVATFNGQQFLFNTIANLVGAFSVGYRENLQLGTDLTPDALMRPPTFAFAPEPGSLALLGLGGMTLLRRRRQARRA